MVETLLTSAFNNAFDYIVVALCGFIIKLLKDEIKERKASNQGMKEILGYMLDRWHEEFILQRYVTTSQLNQFNSVFKAYSLNGGNGAREAKWKEVNSLHIDDTKSNMSPFLQFYFEQKNKMEKER